MDVILLERIAKLGQMGDTVKVKNGFARNYLLPQGKALRANKANVAIFESQRVELEARNLERKSEAEGVHDKLDGNSYIIIRSAGETGQLYGSVTTRDVADSLDEAGFKVARNQVSLTSPIKVIGLHTITISLHPEVETIISVNVARSEDEAKLQASGEDLTQRDSYEMEPVEEEDEVDLSEVFDNPDEVNMGEDEADEPEEAQSVTQDADEETVAEAEVAESEEETK
ncbi:MAG: 50S ribosomal protein L9 [Rhizobiaceae bacterium]|nr:50S ribosomal protein L9 [Rhizobiaceae bacterium]